MAFSEIYPSAPNQRSAPAVRLSTAHRRRWRPAPIAGTLRTMDQPEKRTVLVTGGSRGIGAAIARMFGARGWNAVLTYVSNSAAAQTLVHDLERASARASAYRCDLRVESDITSLFRALDEAGVRVDALINNAGVTGPKTRLEDLAAETLCEIVTVNIVGAILCSREAVRRMSTARGGRGGSIVNISSTATRLGSPNQWIHYAASKGAIDVMTAGLAREVGAEGIRVNAVAPGLTLNDPALKDELMARFETMRHEIPIGRVASADEIAEAVYWLCSDAASYCTGAVLPVAGGR